jgi:hypothetical protein
MHACSLSSRAQFDGAIEGKAAARLEPVAGTASRGRAAAQGLLATALPSTLSMQQLTLTCSQLLTVLLGLCSLGITKPAEQEKQQQYGRVHRKGEDQLLLHLGLAALGLRLAPGLLL